MPGDTTLRRLLSHLAQFSSFSKQGEVLCTRGLEYLLENPGAREALATYLSVRAGVAFNHSVVWRAEVCQKDSARPDLEATTAEGKIVAKVEAKLGAPFGAGQLLSYANDLRDRAGGGLLMVLVPQRRIEEAQGEVSRGAAGNPRCPPTWCSLGNHGEHRGRGEPGFRTQNSSAIGMIIGRSPRREVSSNQ